MCFPFKDSNEVIHKGKELIINRMIFKDAGNYTCSAENGRLKNAFRHFEVIHYGKYIDITN